MTNIDIHRKVPGKPQLLKIEIKSITSACYTRNMSQAITIKPNINNKNEKRSIMYPSTGFRLPPQSLESERAVLGSIMIRPEALHEIVDFLEAKAFYAEKHRLIYKTLVELSQKNDPIDMLSVSTRLKDTRQLDKIGGNAYLAELGNAVPSSANAKYYADVVHKKYLLRSLINAADTISEMGYSESTEEIDEILDAAEKQIFNITATPGSQRFVSIKETLADAWERIEKLHNQNNDVLRGVPTGFRQLDNMLSGLQKADLIILAARPSVGKTSLALNIAHHAAVHAGKFVGVFSLEMSSQQLVDRMIAADSKIDAWKLRTGKLDIARQLSLINESLDRLSKAPIYIDDAAGTSIIRMRSVARRLKAEHGLDLIIVDYLQLMTTSKNYDSMVNQVTEISRSLKALAKEFDVPVLALSQLSRAVEARGGEPKLSDLRDSGSIEQDADVVMFIHREKIEGQEREQGATIPTDIIIAKHRNGPVGRVQLHFDGKTTTFLDPENSFANYVQPSNTDLDDFDLM